MSYNVRIVCETEVGDDKGFHYWRENQATLDDTIDCDTHTSATVRDFIIEEVIA